MCLDAGIYLLANTADHVVPHKGDPVAFWKGKLQSLCPPHHSGDKQREEIGATPLRVDDDGWPTEPAALRGAGSTRSAGTTSGG
jgi:hypothetical protein